MSGDSAMLAKLIKNLKNRTNDPLRPLIDEYMLRRDRSTNRAEPVTLSVVERGRPGGRLSPSTIGGCMRQAAFKFLGLRGKLRKDPDLSMVFDDGNWRHHRWEAMFRDMEAVLGPDRFRVIGVEKQIYIPSLYIAGTLDAEVCIENFGELVVDFKGINDFGFTYVYNNQEPKVEHVRQIHPYMKGAGQDRAIILYENKNSQLTHSILIEFDHAIWVQVQGWCREVIEYLEDRQLPPMHPECQMGNFLYEKCPFSAYCFGSRSPERVRKLAYSEFPGVKRAWKRGNKSLERNTV